MSESILTLRHRLFPLKGKGWIAERIESLWKNVLPLFGMHVREDGKPSD